LCFGHSTDILLNFQRFDANNSKHLDRGSGSLHLRRPDNVIGVELPEWRKPAGMVLL
jgi:hypothetical protein